MNCKALDPRPLKSGDVIEHARVVRAGDGWKCLDCGRLWPAKVEK
jgi:hypothetical protein